MVTHFAWIAFCTALSGLHSHLCQFPGLTPWALLRRRFAAIDSEAPKGRNSKAQGASPGADAWDERALKGRSKYVTVFMK